MTVDDLSLMRREEVLQACRLSKSTMYHLIGQDRSPSLYGSALGLYAGGSRTW